MPEGDTVWLHARDLDRALAGATLTGADLRVPALSTVDLRGWRVDRVASRGKHLLVRLDRDGRRFTLHSHLRMDGRWLIRPAGRAYRPGHTVRVVLATDRVLAIGDRVHDLALVPTAQESRLVGHLGPDLLGDDWDAAEAVRRLAAAPDRPIGPALLDQRNLAGIGNLYKSELAFLRGVSPWAPVRDVPDLPGLVRLAHEVLTANRDRWSQVTTGVDRPGERTFVYGRARRPCRRCGTPVRRAEQSDGPPDGRVTYWCPSCQPEPRRTDGPHGAG
ncbi:Fpg/Nei family DNA glycosylase [Actinocatenispora rupis]|uniref:DNA-(apurinic or apyrimidinic site) lyase n=1 Tax=Actinocatenispora rupis TaxID=519421 RepID=A0A8J3N7E2_9ACTN|nr:Fpg/Nei family DNA glycosylase [Actinocatenispora rupis]GID09229.1 putative endonuclease 8 2 [Actinocatenispora rupis]